jgi:hypothetical protein
MGLIPEFDIELPSWLDWVRPLLQWPVGSETQWWDRARALRDAAAKAEALEPELAGARAHTAAVLVGQAGQAVDRQFAKVFGGDASLPKSVDALQALAEAAEGLGDQIQATKVANITLGAWAVGQLAWLAACAVFTGGASQAEVAVVEAMTEAASRQIAEQGAEEVAGSLLRSLAGSAVGRLAMRTAVGVVVGVGIGVAQTLLSDGVLALEGHAEDAGTLFTELEQAAVSMGLVGGVTGVLSGQAVGALFDHVFGPELSRGMVVFKKALTGLTSAEAANVLATWAGGGQVGEATFAGGLIGVLEAGHQEGKPGVLDRLKNGLGRLTHGRPESPDIAGAFADSAAGQARGPAASVVDRPDGHSGPASTASDAGGSGNDGAPQAHSAAAPAAPAQTPTAASEHATGSAAHGLPEHSDPGAQSSVASTTGHAPSHADVVASEQLRPSEPMPATGNAHSTAVPDPADSGASRMTTGVDPAPATNAPHSTGIREGTLDLSSPARPVSVGPIADAGSPAASDLAGQSGAVGVPAATPDMARSAISDPSSLPPASSDPGPTVGSPNATSDARAGLAESSSATGESAAKPAGAPATHTSDTAAAQAVAGSQHGDLERVEAAQAGGSITERPPQPIDPEPAAAGQAGRSSVDAHLIDRGEGARAESRRPADPLSTRRDRPRPNSSRDDSNRPHGARPGKLHRSGVVRDIPEELQPATSTRTADPLAAGKDIGVIKATHDDTRPDPSEPEPHQGGSDGPQHPRPGTGGGGAGDYRGGDGGRHDSRGGRGDGGRGAGHGGVGPGDSSGAGDPPNRRASSGSGEEPERDDFHHREQEPPRRDTGATGPLDAGEPAPGSRQPDNSTSPPDPSGGASGHGDDGGADAGDDDGSLPDFPDLPGWNEVRQIASHSKTLMYQWQHLRADGWQIKFDGKGGRHDHDARVISIDPWYCENPVMAVSTMAHEFGHAMDESPQRDISSQDAFIQSQLNREGVAIMNELKVRDEILAKNGPDIYEGAGFQLKSGLLPQNDLVPIYDAYVKAGGTSKAFQIAIRAIGEKYKDVVISTSEGEMTYTEYYGQRYEKLIWRVLFGR